MKKLLSKLALMLVVALVMGLGIAVPAMASLTMATDLNKTLLMPNGVVLNDPMVFNFNFAAQPAAATPPAMPTQAAPTIANQSVTVAAGQAAGTTDLAPVLQAMLTANMATLNAGTVDWIVTEVVPSPNPSAAGVTYDTSRFLLRVHIANHMVGGVVQTPPLIISAVEVFPITSAPGATPLLLGDKLPHIPFTNAFVPPTGDATNPPLVVSKTIIGNDFAHANLGTLFRFNMTLTAPTIPAPTPPVPGLVITQPVLPGTPAGTFTATIVSGPGAGTPIADRPSAVNFVGGVATPHFELRHGERLVFPTLPAGTTYTITEIGTPNFTPFADITVGGNVVPPQLTAGIGQNLVVPADRGLVSNAGNPVNNRADFENQYHWAPPQGLVIENAPFFAVGFAALALTLMMASRSRKRIEEMPIAY